MSMFSPKQREFLNNATHRWNVKSGATRSGKTYLDYYVIPKRIRRVRGLEGDIVILGNTRETIRRNVIRPLQKLWGKALVSDIRTSDNTCQMFGETVYCIGADKENQVDRIRGMSIKYCYGDEVVTWSQEVFEMLKSRLDKEYSKFDGTCNPADPNHWFKKFLDSDADIYLQNYTLHDNPFLPAEFVAQLEKEYSGTVFYARYILGLWALAEGLIYKRFADDPKRYEISKDNVPRLATYNIGVDFGGNGSQHAFVLSGVSGDNRLYALKSRSIKATGTDANDLINEFLLFAKECEMDYRIDGVYCDAAEQTLINTIRNRTQYSIYNSIKNPIIDRIRATSLLLGAGRFFYVKDDNTDLINGMCNAVWDSKAKEDKRLDDGTSDIDILDSFEYSWEYNIHRLVG